MSSDVINTIQKLRTIYEIIFFPNDSFLFLENNTKVPKNICSNSRVSLDMESGLQLNVSENLKGPRSLVLQSALLCRPLSLGRYIKIYVKFSIVIFMIKKLETT